MERTNLLNNVKFVGKTITERFKEYVAVCNSDEDILAFIQTEDAVLNEERTKKTEQELLTEKAGEYAEFYNYLVDNDEYYDQIYNVVTDEWGENDPFLIKFCETSIAYNINSKATEIFNTLPETIKAEVNSLYTLFSDLMNTPGAKRITFFFSSKNFATDVDLPAITNDSNNMKKELFNNCVLAIITRSLITISIFPNETAGTFVYDAIKPHEFCGIKVSASRVWRPLIIEELMQIEEGGPNENIIYKELHR